MKARAVLLTVLVSMPAAAQPIYDLLLKNGHVIDPANGRNGRFDIAITGDRIAAIGNSLPASHARRVVELGE
ncbi:MAG: hypothetical protein KJZ78_24260, partial [Bryobacteraceae bacterium]|nr:hypothetical protein [Bryobacteraceae bacterium]